MGEGRRGEEVEVAAMGGRDAGGTVGAHVLLGVEMDVRAVYLKLCFNKDYNDTI